MEQFQAHVHGGPDEWAECGRQLCRYCNPIFNVKPRPEDVYYERTPKLKKGRDRDLRLVDLEESKPDISRDLAKLNKSYSWPMSIPAFLGSLAIGMVVLGGFVEIVSEGSQNISKAHQRAVQVAHANCERENEVHQYEATMAIRLGDKNFKISLADCSRIR